LLEQLRVGVGDEVRGVPAECGGGLTDGRVVAFELHEHANGRLVDRDEQGRRAAILLAEFLVAEGRLEADAVEDGRQLIPVVHARLVLGSHLEGPGQGRALVRQHGGGAVGAYPDGSSARPQRAVRRVEQRVVLQAARMAEGKAEARNGCARLGEGRELELDLAFDGGHGGSGYSFLMLRKSSCPPRMTMMRASRPCSMACSLRTASAALVTGSPLICVITSKRRTPAPAASPAGSRSVTSAPCVARGSSSRRAMSGDTSSSDIP